MRPEARKTGGKVEKVMREFGSGKLRSSSGQKVTNRKQAVAIALSEQRRAKKYAKGGSAEEEYSMSPSGQYVMDTTGRGMHTSIAPDFMPGKMPEAVHPAQRRFASEAAVRKMQKKYVPKVVAAKEEEQAMENANYARGGAIAKQDTRHGSMDMPFKKLNRFAGMKEGGNVESKGMMKKEVAFMKKKGAPKSMLKHEMAEMKGYARGGKIKEVMGPRTMSQDVEGGSKARSLKYGEHSEQKRGHTRGTVIKMASGGSVRGHGEHSIQKSGHTKGRMV